MTISEFESKIKLDKLVKNFFNPDKISEYAMNNIQFKDYAAEANRLFEKNKSSILNNFFENVNRNLTSENYESLFQNCSILIFDPFDENHLDEFTEIFVCMNSKIEESNLDANLLIFYWTLIDHILHGNIFDKFDLQLKQAKNILEKIDSMSDEKDLMLQKINQHYGL